jgi:hypothetical protein
MVFLEQIAGAVLTVVVLLDIFLTVLYARAGTSLFSHLISRAIWFVFRLVSRPFNRHRGQVLSFCGPVILIVLILVWAAGLALGSALIMHPHLGDGIRASGGGSTPRDFMSALYAAGNSLSFVGSSEFKPQSPVFQAFYLLNSLIGMSVMSLVLTYVMQIYSALKTRNTLGLAIRMLSDDTGDAAELIAGLGPQGQFNSGFSDLSNLASNACEVKEAHHFYPLLFYFRFAEPYYSVSQTATVLLDSVSLMKSGLNDEYSWLKESATVAQCWRAAILLVNTLEEIFLQGRPAQLPSQPDARDRERWRTRYMAALDRLRQAGIKTIDDPAAGFEIYVSLRERWDGHIARLRTSMAYEADEIDKPTYCPEVVRARPPFEHRLRDV